MVVIMLKTIFVCIWLIAGALSGQEVEILPDATAAFAKRVHAIRSTQPGETIRMSSFIFAADDLGKLITVELARALERGVKVEVLFDGLGLSFVKPTIPYLEYLNLKGATVKRANLLFGPPISFNRRMHDKILLIENNMSIIGGRNLWANSYDLSNKPQLDMEVIISHEETLKEIREYWNERWESSSSVLFTRKMQSERGRVLRKALEEHYAKFKQSEYYVKFKEWLTKPTLQKVKSIRFIKDNRWKRFLNLPQLYSGLKTWDHVEELELLLAKAKTEILIESPWVVLTNRMKKSLADARARGVRVKILTNSEVSSEASYRYHVSRVTSAKFMEKHGIEVFEYPVEASLHSKYVVVDRQWSYVGSFNLSPRSERLNSETGVIIESEDRGKELAAEFNKRAEVSCVAPPFNFFNNPCINLMGHLLGTQM